MTGFEFGLILGVLLGSLLTLKISKWLILWQLRHEEHQKVDATYEGRKKKYIQKGL